MGSCRRLRVRASSAMGPARLVIKYFNFNKMQKCVRETLTGP